MRRFRSLAPATAFAAALAMLGTPARAHLFHDSEPPTLRARPQQALSDTGDDDAIDLRPIAATIRSEIAGTVVRTTYDYVFDNPFDVPIEIAYVHPLGHDTAVDRFELEVGDRIVVGQIRRRLEAREIYAAAASAGHTAALLEQHRPDLFQQQVANVAPGDPIVVRVGTVHVVASAQGTFELRIPLHVAARYEGAQASPAPVATSIAVTLDTGLPIVMLASPTHRIREDRSDPGRATVAVAPLEGREARDFVLRWSVASPEPDIAVLTHRTGVDGVVSLVVHGGHDEAREREPWNVAFLLDVSGSMSGDGLASGSRFVAHALGRLDERDTFLVARFHDKLDPWRTAPVRASADAIHDAAGWTRASAIEGGTRLPKAIRSLLRLTDSDLPTLIVIVSDALSGEGSEVVEAIRAAPDARFLTVAVGAAPSHALRTRIARAGNGVSTAIAGPEDVGTALDRFATWLGSSPITDVEVDWGALPVGDVAAPTIRDLFPGESLSLSATYHGAGAGPVTIRGRVEGAPWEKVVDVTLPESNADHAAIATVWARLRIEHLLDERRGPALDEIREEVTELALEHRLMSPYTSFVAVDETRVVETSPDPTAARAEDRERTGFSQLAERVDVVPSGTFSYAMAESVTVRATPSVIDLDSTSQATRFSDDFIQDLPVPGRFYQNVSTLAPAFHDDDADGNPTVHGSRDRDFQAVVGGVANVDPLTGRYLSHVNPKSIEEIEVITAGASVEYSRTQCGFATIVSGEGFTGPDGGFELRARSDRLDLGRGGEAPSYTDVRGSAYVAGPIVRSKLAYTVRIDHDDTTAPFDTTRAVEPLDARDTEVAASLAWQPTPRNRLVLRGLVSSVERDGYGTTSLTRPETSTRVDLDGRSVSLEWSSPWSTKTLLEAEAVITRGNRHTAPTDGATQGCVSIPGFAAARCWDATVGAYSGTAPFRFDDDVRSWSVDARVERFVAGHRIKAGFEVTSESRERDVDRAPDLFAGVDEAGVLARVAIDTPRHEATSETWSLWAHDRFRPVEPLTLIFGLRYDLEGLDAPTRDATLAAISAAPGTLRLREGVWSPHVALAWSPWPSEIAVFRGSVRRAYDAWSASLGLVGAEPATVDFVVGTSSVPRIARDYQAIVPRLRVPYHDEWFVAFASRIGATTKLEISRIERRYRDRIGVRPAGVAEQAPDPRTEIGNFHRSDYEAWVLAVDREMFKGFEFHGSYTWSRARGTADPFDPTAGDVRTLVVPALGYLSADRRHVAKFAAAVHTPLGIHVGTRVSWMSGLPYADVETVAVRDGGGGVFVRQRFVGERNRHRSPATWRFDVRARKLWQVGRWDLEGFVDVLNLLDDRTREVRDPWNGVGRRLDGFEEAVARYGRQIETGVRLSF